MTIKASRTPEARFNSLPGYPFAPNYRDDLAGYPGLRMHYLDEGVSNARVALCLHGQPTWSYLYRKMVPGLVASGYRVIAPDMFGFGRSDKPVEDAVYTFDFHRESLMAFIRALDLDRMTLVCQDWGGLLGLTIPMDMADRFEALLVMNTMLATGDRPLTHGFLDWRAWANSNPDMPVGKLMSRCPQLSPAGLQSRAAIETSPLGSRPIPSGHILKLGSLRQSLRGFPEQLVCDSNRAKRKGNRKGDARFFMIPLRE